MKDLPKDDSRLFAGDNDPGSTQPEECNPHALVQLHGNVFRCKWCKEIFTDEEPE